MSRGPFGFASSKLCSRYESTGRRFISNINAFPASDDPLIFSRLRRGLGKVY
jgi:hypothetical protein